MLTMLSVLVALASDTNTAKIEIAEVSKNVFVVHWKDLPGEGALMFAGDHGSREVRYYSIGGHGPFALLEGGRHTLVEGTLQGVVDVVVDTERDAIQLYVDRGRKVDPAAVMASYEAYEHVAAANEGRPAIERAIGARAKATCGGKLAVDVDWRAFGTSLPLAKQAIAILDALDATCADKDYAAEIAKLRVMRVTFRADGGALAIARTGDTLAVTFSTTSYNPRESARTWLEKKL
jgi:hypothetical protein